MDVTSIARLATSMSQERLGQAVSVAVLKESIDSEKSGAMALIAAIPAPAPGPSASGLGQTIDTMA